MATVEFTSRTINNEGEELYHLTMNGRSYTYNKDTDFLEDDRTGDLIERRDLPGDKLRAFQQAWDPEYYAEMLAERPMTFYGVYDAAEDPRSPLYYPVQPSGYPAALRKQLQAEDDRQDLATLAALCYTAGRKVPDDEQAAGICQAIDSTEAGR